MSDRSHVFTIHAGVKVIANGAQAIVEIHEGGRFSEEVILAIANEALTVDPNTSFDKWSGPLIGYSKPFPSGLEDHLVKVLFVKNKKVN